MKQLLTESKIVGKTTVNILSSAGDLWLKFSDGSFTILESEK